MLLAIQQVIRAAILWCARGACVRLIGNHRMEMDVREGQGRAFSGPAWASWSGRPGDRQEAGSEGGVSGGGAGGRGLRRLLRGRRPAGGRPPAGASKAAAAS